MHLLGKMSIQVFCPSFDSVICFVDSELYIRCLYMLDISHLSVITFVTIFFYFICLSLFFFFVFFFDEYFLCCRAFEFNYI